MGPNSLLFATLLTFLHFTNIVTGITEDSECKKALKQKYEELLSCLESRAKILLRWLVLTVKH